MIFLELNDFFKDLPRRSSGSAAKAKAKGAKAKAVRCHSTSKN
jgi:hypothetical protein